MLPINRSRKNKAGLASTPRRSVISANDAPRLAVSKRAVLMMPGAGAQDADQSC